MKNDAGFVDKIITTTGSNTEGFPVEQEEIMG